MKEFQLQQAYEEALRKAFHVSLKEKTGNSIVISTLDGLDGLKEYAVQAGMKLILADDAENELKHPDTIAYYNPNGRERG